MTTATTLEKNRQRADFIGKKLEDEIEEISKSVFDVAPTRIAFPGGKSRSAMVVEIDQGYYVLAKRDNSPSATKPYRLVR